MYIGTRLLLVGVFFVATMHLIVFATVKILGSARVVTKSLEQVLERRR
jgi:hypothetical protein